MKTRDKVFEQIKRGTTRIRDFDLSTLGIKKAALSRLLHRLEEKGYFLIEKGELKEINLEKISQPLNEYHRNLMTLIWYELGFIKNPGPCREILKSLLVFNSFDSINLTALGISKKQFEACLKRLEENRILLNGHPTSFGLVVLGQDEELSGIAISFFYKLANSNLIKNKTFLPLKILDSKSKIKFKNLEKTIKDAYIKVMSKRSEILSIAMGDRTFEELKRSENLEIFKQIEEVVNETLAEALFSSIVQSAMKTFQIFTKIRRF